MKLQIKKGEQSVILNVFIQDSSATTGAGLGSLDESSSITGGYVKRNGTGVALAVDENVTTEGTYQAPSTAAQVRIGTIANMPTGNYELHFHDDLFTTADWVTIGLAGATNMATLELEVQLTSINLNDAVRGGMTALPDAAAEASGGLYTRGTGAGQINQTANGSSDATAVAATAAFFEDFFTVDSGKVSGNEVAGSVMLVGTQITWDRLLQGNTHNINNSAGRRLRQVEAAFTHASGVIATATNNHTFTLDTGAVATADYYIGDRLQIIEGAGAGQSRVITAYTSGRVVTLDSNYITSPDASSLYEIVAADVHVSISDSDLAEGFLATYTNTTTITLDSGAVATTNYYVGQEIFFTHGTGKGQAREITAYTSGRVVTMSPALTTALSDTADATLTTWHIQAVVSIPEIVDEVWNEATSGHTTAGTTGKALIDILTETAGLDGDSIPTPPDNWNSMVISIGGIVSSAPEDASISENTITSGYNTQMVANTNTGLVAQGLDHLLSAAVIGADVTDNSIFAYLVSKSATADWDNFVNTTDSMQAQRDNTGTAGVGLTNLAGISNFSSMIISSNGAIDSLVQGFLNNTIAETTPDNIAANFEVFYDNADSAPTSQTVDDVGIGSGAGDATIAKQDDILAILQAKKGGRAAD